MKKYLINGALALLAGAFVVSCSEKESDFVPLAQQKVKAFDEVFKELYGEIDPYQDWGFGSGKVEIDPNDSSIIVNVVDVDANVAFTRAAPFGRDESLMAFNGGTRTANKNLNQWGDPEYGNYKVPPALTEGQKTRVMAYFQANPYLTYVDPGYTTFFVQQVYKGNPATAGALSTEQYTQTNGTKLTGSDNMDWLYAGRGNDHINDFNCGEWNNGTPLPVLNTGASTNDYEVEGKTHLDQITLMENSSTEYIAFGSSTGNFYHTDCCALAGWSVIEAWAIAHKDSLERIGRYGSTLDDGWNRSFVGLDYENRKVDDLYSNKGVAKALDFCVSDYVLYKGQIKAKSSFTDFELTNPKGDKVRYVTDNVSNQAIADYIKVNGNNVTKDTYNYNMTKAEFAAKGVTITNNEARVYNLDMVMGYIRESALPTDNNGNWVKNIGGRDYVFSDWIVTLTNAGHSTLRTEYPVTSEDTWTQIERGRVFCEDLGQATREDLDFNDVVFDAIIFSNYSYYKKEEVKYVNGVETSRRTIEYIPPTTKYYANVTILAAGGTIPITINSNKENGPSFQVHSQFNPAAGVATMINTRDHNSTAFGSYDVRNAVQIGNIDKEFQAIIDDNGTKQTFNVKLFEIDPPTNDEKYIKEIQIWSSFGEGTQVSELEHVKGGAPQKFMVPLETKWASERKNISLVYPGFDAWVKDRTDVPDWENPVVGYFYDGVTSSENQLPLVMKARRTVVTEAEKWLWNGPATKFEGSWSLADLEATLDVAKFYAGDRLRFYGKGIGKEAWITVVVGNITPYFIDSNFPDYIENSDGTTTQLTADQSSCVEVLLDESSAALLNNQIKDGKVVFQVQGRNFTLTHITRVEF